MEISNNENKMLFLISYPTNKIYVHKPLQTIILQAMACMTHVLSRLLWELSWVYQGCLHWTLLISSPTMWVLHSTCRVPCHLVVTLYRFWPLTLSTCALNPTTDWPALVCCLQGPPSFSQERWQFLYSIKAWGKCCPPPWRHRLHQLWQAWGDQNLWFLCFTAVLHNICKQNPSSCLLRKKKKVPPKIFLPTLTSVWISPWTTGSKNHWYVPSHFAL